MMLFGEEAELLPLRRLNAEDEPPPAPAPSPLPEDLFRDLEAQPPEARPPPFAPPEDLCLFAECDAGLRAPPAGPWPAPDD